MSEMFRKNVLQDENWVGPSLGIQCLDSDSPPIVIVLDNQQKLLKIPSSYAICLPAQNLSVKNFLQFSLPAASTALATQNAEECFSKKEPNDSLEKVFERTVPPAHFVECLGKYFAQ